MQSEQKKQFTSYLEDNGIIDLLTNALVNLYEKKEKPENAIEFLTSELKARGNTSSSQEETRFKIENESLKMRISELEKEVSELKQKLADSLNAASQSVPVEKSEPAVVESISGKSETVNSSSVATSHDEEDKKSTEAVSEVDKEPTKHKDSEVESINNSNENNNETNNDENNNNENKDNKETETKEENSE